MVFVISKLVVQIAGAGAVTLCHGPSLQRLTISPDLAEAFELFRDGATRADLADACGDAALADKLIDLFARHNLIVDASLDEPALWAARLGLASPITGYASTGSPRKFDKVVALTAGDLRPITPAAPTNPSVDIAAAEHAADAVADGPAFAAHASATAALAAPASAPAPLSIALIGGCFVEVLADFLSREAMRRGELAELTYAWPDGAERIHAAAADAELAILHPFVRSVLEPVWSGYGRGVADLEARVAQLIAAIEAQLRAFAAARAGRLGLVHNLTAPQLSPRGRYDHGFAAIVHRINAALLAACAPHANLVILDEEAIAAAVGKHRVLDDLHHAYTHHGHGLTGEAELPPWADHTRSAAFCSQLATHALDALDVWRGRNRLKCVIVDLDHTLWPGVLGDEGIDFTRLAHFEGIHEALHLLKTRGVLLASCSKNDEAATLDAWRALGPPFTAPEDFVAHRINWRRKSENVAALATALGLAHDAILFVDDSPLERAEVSRALPAIHVWHGAIHDLRHDLLTDPRFDTLTATPEAARRTEMMQAQLRRDERRTATDDHSFLASLGIELTIAPAAPTDAPRLCELFQRTNQLNTSLIRHAPPTVAALIARREVWTLHVRDRFTDYGLVGAIVLRTAHIETVVLSCRVIGLACAVPFLATVLTRTGLASLQPRATLTIGPRNHPARSVFTDAGFTLAPDGTFTLVRADDLPAIDPAIYRITISADAGRTAGAAISEVA